MHWECYTFFESCKLLNLLPTTHPKILDVGSYDINGSLRFLFPSCDYTGLDLDEGPGVDLVVSGAEYTSEIKYDIALSCECFEHNPQYLSTFKNMIDLTKEDGLVVFTCATLGRAEHGTRRTSPYASIASQQVSSDYYRNLTQNDFLNLNLSDYFSSYSFYVNEYSHDLYFIGRKRAKVPNDSLQKVSDIPAVTTILEVSKKFSDIDMVLKTCSPNRIRELTSDIYSNYEMSNLALTRLMKYLIFIGDYNKALELGELASSFAFNQVANLTLQSRCYFKLGKLNEAYSLMKLVKNMPQIMNPKNVVFMASIELKLFNVKKALKTIKKSLDIYPNDRESIWRLYVWSKKVGNVNDSTQALAKMKSLYPEDKRLIPIVTQ